MAKKRFKDEIERLFYEKLATPEGSTGNIETWTGGKDAAGKKIKASANVPDHMIGLERPGRKDIELKKGR